MTSVGNFLTTTRRSGLGTKFYSKKKCRLRGSFCHMNNPVPHDEPTILEVRFSSLENTDLGSQPCGQGSMWPCVCWEMYTFLGFLADFPCEQKQKSTKRTRKLGSWPAKGKAEPEVRHVKRMTPHKWKERSNAGEARAKARRDLGLESLPGLKSSLRYL